VAAAKIEDAVIEADQFSQPTQVDRMRKRFGRTRRLQ